MAAGFHIAATAASVRGHERVAGQLWHRAVRVIGESGGARLGASCYAGLSRIATRAGRYDEAAAHARRGLDLLHARGGSRRSRLLTSALNNQAGIALRLDGRTEDARTAYTRALADLSQARRLRSRRAAAVYHNLGGLAFAERRYADAEEHAKHALRLNRRALPRTPLRVAADLGMLGAIVAAAGRLEEGERLLSEALEAFEERLGPSHREVALVLGNLAEVRRELGDHDRARLMAARALAVGQDALGHRHPELAPIVNTLFLASQAREHDAESLSLLADTANWLEHAVAPQHPALLACRASLRRAERAAGVGR